MRQTGDEANIRQKGEEIPIVPQPVGQIPTELAVIYLSAVDDQLAKELDQPSTGLVLCKEHNHVIVEYTLRNMESPLGVASYQLLPEDVQSRLPSPEQLESVLEDDHPDEDKEDA